MRIALIGYGKMGHMIEQIALRRGHEIVSVIDVDNQADFESEAFRSADVAIEFTTPQAAYGNFLKAFAAGVKVCRAARDGFPRMARKCAACVAKRGRRFSGAATSVWAWPCSAR